MISKRLQILLRAIERGNATAFDNLVELGVETGHGVLSISSLTLLVSGCMVTGTAITAREYFEAIRKAPSQDFAKTLMESLFPAPPIPEEPSNGEEEVWPQFVYLKDVKIRSGSLDMNLELFTVSLDSIDGWTFGTFN